MRDFILSFKLPYSALGVRKGLLLSREANTFATKTYPEVLNAAHEAAMRGAQWTYQQDPDPIHKVAALLAGLALIMVKTKDDVRKGNAFMGRVSLPFLEVPPPDGSVRRMALVSQSGDWVVYKPKSSGKPRVEFRGHGVEGLKDAVLMMNAA